MSTQPSIKPQGKVTVAGRPMGGPMGGPMGMGGQKARD